MKNLGIFLQENAEFKEFFCRKMQNLRIFLQEIAGFWEFSTGKYRMLGFFFQFLVYCVALKIERLSWLAVMITNSDYFNFSERSRNSPKCTAQSTRNLTAEFVQAQDKFHLILARCTFCLHRISYRANSSREPLFKSGFFSQKK